MNKILEKLSLLPEKSGVYIMLDYAHNIIYVGKAKNLKNRVRQYFQGNSKNPKTESLVSRIYDFEYIVTNSELEALILENNLIKLHKPYYNILLKDDKTYPYIKVDIKLDFPSIEVVRKIKKTGRYFGPYMLGISASAILDLIHEVFPVRSCMNSISKNNKKPCLEYHLGRCTSPCSGKISQEQYKEMIDDIINFLSGENKKVRLIIEEKLKKAIEKEQFELAIRYRDFLKLIEKIERKQSINIPSDVNADIFSYASNGVYGTINQMVIRGGRLSGSINHGINEIGEPQEIIDSFIMQHYEYNPLIASEIYLQDDLSFSKDLEEYLSNKAGKKITVLNPKRGMKRDLLEMSLNNAKEYLEKNVTQIENKNAMTVGAAERLSEILGIKGVLRRIECFDISNISGVNIVSSMVVFVNGEPERKLYRMFRIKTVQGSNDYASMRETILRRFAEYHKGEEDSFQEKPNLVIVDGGKGQVSCVSDILENEGVPLIGLAEKNEEIFLPGQKNPVILSKDDLALKLCQRIRDEAHRFVVNYHRRIRSNKMLESDIKKIAGIGDVKANALYNHFKNYEKIISASLKELTEVKGIGERDAKAILLHFSQLRDQD
jgi:excinuclease ABC subunit C